MEDKAARAKNIIQWVAIFILIVLIVVGITKLLGRSKPVPPAKKSHPAGSVVRKVSPLPEAGSTGTLKLSLEDNTNFASTDKQAVIRVVASSGNVPVVGYDVVLAFDPSALAYVSTDHSLEPDYSGKVRASSGRLTISGIVDKKDAKPREMADTVLAAIHFQPLKTGKTVLTFAFTSGATDESNIMSADSRDILNKVSPLSLTVGKPLRINLNETKQIEGSPYSLRLDRVGTPPTACRDCITSQDLTFIDPAKHTQTAFGFRTGGFSGIMHDEARMGGYIFKLRASTDSSITVLVAAE